MSRVGPAGWAGGEVAAAGHDRQACRLRTAPAAVHRWRLPAMGPLLPDTHMHPPKHHSALCPAPLHPLKLSMPCPCHSAPACQERCGAVPKRRGVCGRVPAGPPLGVGHPLLPQQRQVRGGVGGRQNDRWVGGRAGGWVGGRAGGWVQGEGAGGGCEPRISCCVRAALSPAASACCLRPA